MNNQFFFLRAAVRKKKNWLHVGHPDAGPRLANLFTVVENCRLLGVDPEAYLIDLIARLPDHPAAKVAELLPRAWARPAAATTAGGCVCLRSMPLSSKCSSAGCNVTSRSPGRGQR